MAVEIKMPQLSDTMSSGKILVWKKSEGDSIERGDILAEVETDKANLEIESFHKGILLKIAAPAGTKANVGETIALLGAAGEKVTSSNPPLISPAVITSPPQNDTPIVSPPLVSNLSSSPVPMTGRVKASPLAKKLASQLNVDISKVRGSGPQGRIVRRDVEDATTEAPALAQSSEVVTRPILRDVSVSSRENIPPGSGQLTPFSKMRDTIARRMQESVTTIPHFYVSTSINMDAALELRTHLKEETDFKGVTINHLIMKAAAYAVKKEPRVNRAVKDGQLFEPAQINIGVVTAIEDGLLIPVVKDADRLSLKDLIFEARAAIDRARAGRPNSTDLVGGTFSISNLGMYDVNLFTAIINPGQGSILAVSSIKEQPVAKDGKVIVSNIMNVVLSVDHRVIDGVMAGIFLQHLKKALEMPALLLL